MTNDKVHIPPFKTQGIKSKLVPLIKNHAKIDESTVWIEPFMGSGVVGLNVAPKRAIFADLNPHIINFYNQLKNQEITSKIVRSYLQEQNEHLLAKSAEHYYFIRERFNKEHDPLDFLFLNRSCFNGMIRFNKSGGFNVPYCHKAQRFAKAYVTKIVNQVGYLEEKLRISDWEFLVQPFDKTIALANKNSFIYCDPPYIGRHVDYFDSWDEKQEQVLHDNLLRSQALFMLSTWVGNKYRSNPYLDTLWSDCHVVTQEHFYFVGARENNRNSMTEALLCNYPMKTLEKVAQISNYQSSSQIALAI
jgi:DNA adenine methylase